jgi:hypothetical protein
MVSRVLPKPLRAFVCNPYQIWKINAVDHFSLALAEDIVKSAVRASMAAIPVITSVWARYAGLDKKFPWSFAIVEILIPFTLFPLSLKAALMSQGVLSVYSGMRFLGQAWARKSVFFAATGVVTIAMGYLILEKHDELEWSQEYDEIVRAHPWARSANRLEEQMAVSQFLHEAKNAIVRSLRHKV